MHHAMRSDKGRVRAVNEDAVGADAERGLFVIADGMGGHERGEVASRLAVDMVFQVLSGDLAVPPGKEEILDLLRGAALMAHQRVLAENQDAGGSSAMGTTLTIAKIADGILHFAHVGDSRLVCIGPGGRPRRLTRDQTLAQKMRDDGTDPADIHRRHQSTLLQAVGLKGYLVPATGTHPVEPGTTFLLCTDGLSDLVAEDEIAGIIVEHGDDVDGAADALLEKALEAGGSDNISLIVIRT